MSVEILRDNSLKLVHSGASRTVEVAMNEVEAASQVAVAVKEEQATGMVNYS